MDLRFDGKTVLVTGASGGIGGAIAKGFGEAGADVVVHYRNNRAAAEDVLADIERTATGVCVECDLAASDGPDALMREIRERRGRLDVVVNSAGALPQRAELTATSDELFETLVAVNLASVFRVCRAAIPLLAASAPASIVNISSISARTGGPGGSVVYAALKAAVSTMTRGLAKELVPLGIRVNTVAPGLIDTPLLRSSTPPELLRSVIATVPLSRPGRVEECVGPVLFLASTAASYVNGQSLEVNGAQGMP